WSRPATAFPSSINASISASRRSEALGLDSQRLVAELHEGFCNCFDERRRAAHVDLRPLGRRRPDLRQHLGVDAPRVAAPAGPLRAREGVDHSEAVTVQSLELVAVD